MPATTRAQKAARQAETTNQASSFVSLPQEIQLMIFKNVVVTIFEDIREAEGNIVVSKKRKNSKLLMRDQSVVHGIVISNFRFNAPARGAFAPYDKRNAHVILHNHGRICKALRVSAVAAYYESGQLRLHMVEDVDRAEERRKHQRPLLTNDTWDRFGRIYGPEEVEKQYAIELPPRHVRPYIRHVLLELVVPEGQRTSLPRVLGVHSIKHRYMGTTWFDDEENDWLAPVFKMYGKYGFSRAAHITVKIVVYYCRSWTKDLHKELLMWVRKKLRSNPDVAEAMDKGTMELEWQGVDRISYLKHL